MANSDQHPGIQAAEDIHGHPTTVRGEPLDGLPLRGPNDEDEFAASLRHATGEEHDPAAALGAIPEGEGARSDRGTHPAPETSRSEVPGGKAH